MTIKAGLYYFYSKFVRKILIGRCIRNSSIDNTACVNSGCSVYNSTIGRYSYMGYDCEVLSTDIGNFCSLASGIHTGLAEHPLHWISTSPVFMNVKNSSVKKRFASLIFKSKLRTVIGHDVWIGTNAIIKAGVHIGTGAVIASGAVVTKDVEAYAIVGGCPAKLIKYRFEKDLIDKLLQSNWWNMDDKSLALLGNKADNPEEFIKTIDSLKSSGGGNYNDCRWLIAA